MAPSNDIGIFKDALLILGTAGVIVPVMHKLKISPILSFLAVGAALGPHGLGKLAAGEPVLEWFTVTGERQISVLADMGIVFLLFFIGLELSLRRLRTMRRLVFGLGGLQSVLGTLSIGLIALAAGQPPAAALIIGASLALSSTAIVVELLSRQHRMAGVTGRTSFAILLAQDLAVVPLLFLIGVLGNREDGSIALGIVLALGQAAIAVIVIGLVGRALLRPLFRLVASTDSSELFMAATLLIAVGAGVVAALAGLSMALGAFIAGLLLAETEYRRAIEAIIEPFKGLLLGVFFFSVGMHIELAQIWEQPLVMAAGVAALLIAKTALIAPLCRLWGLPWAASVEIGLLLAPGGEFAFIGLGMASLLNLVGAEVAATVLAVVSLTMALLPLLASAGRRLATRLETGNPSEPLATVLPPDDHVARVLVVGHGRVGQLVCDMLDHHKVPYLATDRDPVLVSRWRKRGRPIYYGDVSNRLFLERCGIGEAPGVILTIDNYETVEEIVRTARARRPDVLIVARARDAQHARHLYTLGVTDTVPETIEASLQLAESALVGLGVPMGLVIASIHERREVVRKELQAAAGGPGALATTVREARREAARTRDLD
ncbi:MAG TPA: cation:proton antiporter [Reyranella sp.]|nr:cation:proton antiporter [Reyranella sp.]